MAEPVHFTGVAYLIEFPGGHKGLVCNVTFTCPTCGNHQLQFCGRHLRQLRDWAIATIDEYTTLTGRDSDITNVERLTFDTPKGGES